MARPAEFAGRRPDQVTPEEMARLMKQRAARIEETAEIHLASGFQNALFEHPEFPKELHEAIEHWCNENAADER